MTARADELRALAGRVEALMGPCFATECEIERAVSPHWTGEGAPKAYTASLDAAGSLVGDNHWKAEDHPLAGPCAVVGDSEAYAATPALALTAAALRAIAETVA
jgi:hypothetical protein